jgi:lipid II:glycine glycyltransferase (peptidoglycan interpeptide bridge formation enzyme)
MSGGDSAVAAAFPHLLNALFQGEGIVAEFAHLHPWLQFGTLLKKEDCHYDRDIVWVDTSLSLDDLWRTHFEYACRKQIKQAERAGVRVITASSDDHIREFYRVYRHTMERNEAEESYYLSYEFFRAVRDELPENSSFVLAEYRDQIVSGALCLHDGNDVFALFGGADSAFHHVRPTNAYFWGMIRWAHEAGKKRLVLGGGNSTNDGIFRFKAGFSRLRQPFYVYKHVHRAQDYAQLERRFRESSGLSTESITYFPVYRYQLRAVEASTSEREGSHNGLAEMREEGGAGRG